MKCWISDRVLNVLFLHNLLNSQEMFTKIQLKFSKISEKNFWKSAKNTPKEGKSLSFIKTLSKCIFSVK